MPTQTLSVGTEMQLLLLADPAWMRRCAEAGLDTDIVLDPSFYPALLESGEVVVFNTGEDNLFTVVITDDPDGRSRHACADPAEFVLQSSGRMLFMGNGEFDQLGEGRGVGDGNYSGWVDLPTGTLAVSVHAVTRHDDPDGPDFVVFARPAPVDFRPTERFGMPTITADGVEEADPEPIDDWYARTRTEGDRDTDRKASGKLQLPVRLFPEVIIGPDSSVTQSRSDSSWDMSGHGGLRPFIAVATEGEGAPGCVMECQSQRRRGATEKDVTWRVQGFGRVETKGSTTGRTAALVACPPPVPTEPPLDVESMRAQLISWLRAHPPQPPTRRMRSEAVLLSHATAMRTATGLLEWAFRALPLPLAVVLPMAVADDAQRWQLLTDFYGRLEQ
ncbi:hypothetical protein [Propioniciclava soli]|uniref:hypothetical protein n=1 Tax=Propioniciclava soli TaxID=2775081 RepID=UPI001E3004BE|nr:hypothetical protein [Propioniciclava soli]